MENFFAAVTTNNTIALVIASVIFIVTIALASRKLINFFITLILLFFAVVSGVAIANNDIVRDYLKTNFNIDPQEYSLEEDTRIEALKDKVWSVFEQLVDALSNAESLSPQSEENLRELLRYMDTQKSRIQAYLDHGKLPDDGRGLLIPPPYDRHEKL